jgi:hypothetical protein
MREVGTTSMGAFVTRLVAGLAFALTLGAAPAAASTGNGVIAFVRGGDVWTMRACPSTSRVCMSYRQRVAVSVR